MVSLPCRHIPDSFSAAPFILATRLTVVLPPKRPELRCDSAATCSGLIAGFLAASEVPATAFVRIWRFCNPNEFGADLVDGGVGALHSSSLDMSTSGTSAGVKHSFVNLAKLNVEDLDF